MVRPTYKEVLTLTMQPSCINLTNAISALDTAQSVCSEDCVNGEETDEAEVSSAVAMGKLALDQTTVGVNDNIPADKAVDDHSSERMEQDEVAIDANETIAKGSSESVSRVSADTDASETFKAQMDGMCAQIADIVSKLEGKVPVSVPKNKAKKRSSRGAPTVPRILKRSHNSSISKEISHRTVPDGPLEEYKQCYQQASPAIAREILCISECIRFHRSQGFCDSWTRSVLCDMTFG